MKILIKKYTFLLSMATILGFSNCSTDWFTPVVDVEIPPHVPKLVIYANWQTNEDTLTVFVSQSRGSLDSSFYDVDSVITAANGRQSNFQYDTVAGAKVELYRNDVLVRTLPQIGKGLFGVIGRNLTDSLGGSTYKLVVSAPNFTTVEAVQPLLSRPAIRSVRFTADGAFYTDPNALIPQTPQKGDGIDIEFDDPSGETNFYDVLAMTFERDSAGGVFYSRTFTPRSIDALSDAEVLGDGTFNGKTYKWQFWATSRDYSERGRGGGPGGGGGQPQFVPRAGDRLRVTFRTFNRDWQLFKKSRSLLQQAQNNPFFSEPVQLHTNIKNGYGLFFLNAERTLTFRLP